ncbi:helix-turn-helix domain-containing protein [Acidithiobacillus sp. VAN18-1]|uniref:Helix-turn-helix domain-containing protein n=1 Tax=Igneacidithiobacillus copahuensis TaxID=2724909 RepID=A0AAE2YR98_9PROT|nr:Cro/CI family transcriptional regulator [Igneacidithiobacillus copahuensis]MBU2788606.1 helix-turn-helix domain-containing protein [Igneacidithiobacillus copahuensis]MBU2796710.1 helix-turn-helix domain-containing protein [Acidithiobacillus sp. VAN18-2]
MLAIIRNLGGPSVVARAIGIRQAAVSQWQHIPVRRVIPLMRAFGIPAFDLRPDLFGPDTRIEDVEQYLSQHPREPAHPSGDDLVTMRHADFLALTELACRRLSSVEHRKSRIYAK